ncbi:diguanylate cyclase [Alcaligenaceae bacterium]|nr:diguanylate cyclase [Alcaligenaceae bacterium]
MSPRQNLYTEFLRRLLPLLALAYVLTATISAGLYYLGQQEEARNQRQQTLETFAHVLVKPLWDCNSLTARGIVHAMTLQPNVRWASAPDQCAQQLIQSGTSSSHASAETLSTPLRYVDEHGRSHPLGELSVAFEPVSIFTAASRSLVPQLVIFLSMLIAVLAGALWVFERTIGKPLEQLRRAMHDHEALDPVPAGWTAEITEVTQTYNAQLQTLRNQARRDMLTGLGNRLKLEEELDRAIRLTARTGSRGHVLLLDLDHFKTINDEFGHAAGDEILRTVAQRLLACVRDIDTVARLGGDEFVIIVANIPHDLHADHLIALTKRIRHSLAQPIPWKDTFLQVRASIGLAEFGLDGSTISALLERADARMYLHKTQRSQSDPA